MGEEGMVLENKGKFASYWPNYRPTFPSEAF